MNEVVERLMALSDTQLLDALQNSIQAERQSTAALVAHIAEVDARRLYLKRAKPSMFSYCVDVLKLSEQAAYLRIHAARLTRRFPRALDGLAAGRLHLTALKLVGPHLTKVNSDALLERVSGKSRRAIERELARLFPREDAPSQLRKLPAKPGQDCGGARKSPALRVPVDTFERSWSEPSSCEHRFETNSSSSALPFERHRPSDVSRCTALSESRYRLQVTIPEQTRAKLDAACDLLRHQIPDGDLALVLDHALDALIEARLKRKFAKTSRSRREGSSSKPNAMQASTTEPSDLAPPAAESRPRPRCDTPRAAPVSSSSSQPDDSKQRATEYSSELRSRPRSRHIPNAIKRAIVERDGMRCCFVDEQGERCTATSPLEFHHCVPFAKGGAHSADNVFLLCRGHNGLEAVRDYGRMMERYQRPPSSLRERRTHDRDTAWHRTEQCHAVAT
ncbi:MAG: HNH endonuclease [Myxococcota bacterium]